MEAPVPVTPEALKKTVFYLDGLRYSFAMANLAARRITATLDVLISKRKAAESYEDEITSALLDAWSLVDMCHRARELIRQIPGMSGKSPEVQTFLRATSQIEELRHYVQHFRSEIPNIPLLSNPLWGALSWVDAHDESTCYTIFSGNLVPGVQAPSLTYDTHEKRFVARLVLTAGGTTIDLLSIAERLRELRVFSLKWIDQQTQFKRVEGKTTVFEASLRRTTSP